MRILGSPMFLTCATAALVSVNLSFAEDSRRLLGDLRAHDPSSIIREGDRYFLFSTGWGLRTKYSDDMVHWEEGTPVFTSESNPEWTQQVAPGFRGHYWAPDVVQFDGGRRLYYSVSRFGKQTSAIGLATSPILSPGDLGAGWVDRGIVIQSHEGDPYNAIDPSVLVADDGRHWMAFGSYWGGIHLIELDPATGLLADTSGPPIQLAYAAQIEAATLLRHDEWHYLFVNHGLCCRGVDSTYRIVVGRSHRIEGPYIDKTGNALTEGGGSEFLVSRGPRIGPGHVAFLSEPNPARFGFHYYDGDDQGRSKLGMATLRWSPDGWPAATDIQLAAPDVGASSRRQNKR